MNTKRQNYFIAGVFLIGVPVLSYTLFRSMWPQVGAMPVVETNNPSDNVSAAKDIDNRPSVSLKAGADIRLERPIGLTAEIGGRPVSFVAKKLELNAFLLPEGDGLYLYEKLLDRAKDEPVAARLLSELLTRCSTTPVNRGDYDDAIKRLVDENVHPSADLNRPRIVSDKAVASIKADFEHDFEQCSTLSAEKRGEAESWARLAAQGGDYLGLELLGKAPNISATERLASYEKRWTDFGDVNGALNLSGIFLGGGESLPKFEGIAADPVKAYAYFLAGTEIEVAIIERSNAAEAEQIRYENSVAEQRMTSGLSAQEHLDAESLAIELIESNPNCCAYDTSTTYQVTVE